MKLPRVRFTVRRLMVLVAIVGIFVGLGVEGAKRRARFRELAAKHQEKGMQWFAFFPGGKSQHQDEMMRLYEERVGPTIEYYCGLRDKYERASLYPWLPVGSDPPPPPEPATSYPWLPIVPGQPEPKQIPSAAKGEL